MTSVTFENATISEVVKRIERVTPKKGEAFDKASGVVFEITPGADWPVVVRATNLELFYTEWVNALEVDMEEPVLWRLPSFQLAQIATKLPIGSGKTTTFALQGGRMIVTSGRFKANIGMISPEFYPTWEPFDPSGLTAVSDLGSRIEQVAWATAKGTGDTMTALRFNGETLAATDKYRLASVPMKMDGLDRDLVVPIAALSPLIKQMGDTNIGIVGNLFAMMPNEYTQIMASIYEAPYPKIERVMARDQPNSVKFNRDLVAELIGRVSTADSKNRMPEMQVFIGDEEIAFFVKEADGDGYAGDVLEVAGQAQHERFMFRITPQNMLEAMGAAPNAVVDLHYTVGQPMKLLRIDGGSGYEAWLTTRTGFEKPAPTEESA